MSLNTSVSGINAAQAALDVASNDLANAQTVGFKSGSQRFSDVYTNAPDTPGIGVRASNIERSFAQGNVQSTGNPLDLAVQGNGFFITSHNGQQQYTRDGQFQIDPATNQLITASGDSVLGYTGATTAGGTLSPLVINQGGLAATPTSSVGANLSLNQGDTAIASSTPFSTTNPNSYNESTSVVAYDSLGDPNHVDLYFRKQAGTGSGSAPDTWQVYAQPVSASGSAVGSATPLTTLNFTSSGTLASGGSAALTVNWGIGAAPSNIAFNFGGTTLAAQNFAVNNTTNNGYPPGTFQNVQIGSDGSIQALFSNNQTTTVGHIALATFSNQQGLQPVSNNAFLSTSTSGNAVVNLPGQGPSGKIASGQLEQSNVDLSSKLVALITDQQAYQANTKSISTDKQDVQSLLQI